MHVPLHLKRIRMTSSGLPQAAAQGAKAARKHTALGGDAAVGRRRQLLQPGYVQGLYVQVAGVFNGLTLIIFTPPSVQACPLASLTVADLDPRPASTTELC